jgi:hypothetical protein
MSTPADEPVQAPTPAAPAPEHLVPCGRCGTFIQDEPLRLRGLEVCRPCAALLAREYSLYGYVPLNVVGILGFFMLTGLLSAINWSRLGNRRRMWLSIGVAVVGAGWIITPVIMVSSLGEQWPLSPFFRWIPVPAKWGIAIVTTFLATWGMRAPYKEHLLAGGRRSSVFLPWFAFMSVMLAGPCLSDISRAH